MKTQLWLDDIRNPFEHGSEWLVFSPFGRNCNTIWVKTQEEFEHYIMVNGLPDAVCFDHDLGTGNGDGYGCAKFLCKYCEVHNLKLPKFSIHSANTVGKQNIQSYLDNYKKYCE